MTRLLCLLLLYATPALAEVETVIMRHGSPITLLGGDAGRDWHWAGDCPDRNDPGKSTVFMYRYLEGGTIIELDVGGTIGRYQASDVQYHFYLEGEDACGKLPKALPESDQVEPS